MPIISEELKKVKLDMEKKATMIFKMQFGKKKRLHNYWMMACKYLAGW